VELGLVLALLGGKFDMGFVWITLARWWPTASSPSA
jgi:hypothetical protein